MEVINISEFVSEIATFDLNSSLEWEMPAGWTGGSGLLYNYDACNHWTADNEARLYFRFVGDDDAYLDLTDGSLKNAETDDFESIEETENEIRFYGSSGEIARISKRRIALTAGKPDTIQQNIENPSRHDKKTLRKHNPRV
jgi:hypothetical protein